MPWSAPSRLSHGKLKKERGAPASAVLEADAPLHHFHQPLADGKTETRAALDARIGRIGLREAAEDAAAEGLGDARPAVADLHPHHRALLRDGYVYGAVRRGEFGGVREQVGHDLHPALGGGPHRDG